MENKSVILPPKSSKQEKLEREYRQVCREKRTSRSRAAVVRSQLVRAYEILENVRFDFVSDTAFREKVVMAKRHIETAIDDFLMSDKYWEDRVDEFYKMGVDGYKKWVNQPICQSANTMGIPEEKIQFVIK